MALLVQNTSGVVAEMMDCRDDVEETLGDDRIGDDTGAHTAVAVVDVGNNEDLREEGNDDEKVQ
jgi:hypothetical protein